MDWSLLRDDETREEMMAEAIKRAVLPITSGEHIDVVRGALCGAVIGVLTDAMGNPTHAEWHMELFRIASDIMAFANATARRLNG